LALAVLPACQLVGGEEEEQAQAEQAPQATAVGIATVEKDALRERVHGIGTLRALEMVELRPEVDGVLLERHFEEGRRVEEGELLYTIQATKLQRELRARRAQWDAAEARLQEARRSFKRIETLVERQSATEEEFDRAQANLDAARAEVDRLEAEIELVQERIEDTTIHAPFTGMISESHVDPGEYLRVGQALATLYRTDILEMDFSLPERFFGRVRPGQEVAVRVAAYEEREFSGVVDFVSPSVEEATRDFRIKSRIPNEAGLLSPGMFGRASITVQIREEAPVVPEESLVSTRAGYIVFVVQDGAAQRREVELGLREPGRVEIRQGVSAGERVVTEGHMRLQDGGQVKVVQDVAEAAAGEALEAGEAKAPQGGETAQP
jgi:membrane fusion protein (multidrug efflux system)